MPHNGNAGSHNGGNPVGNFTASFEFDGICAALLDKATCVLDRPRRVDVIGKEWHVRDDVRSGSAPADSASVVNDVIKPDRNC